MEVRSHLEQGTWALGRTTHLDDHLAQSSLEAGVGRRRSGLRHPSAHHSPAEGYATHRVWDQQPDAETGWPEPASGTEAHALAHRNSLIANDKNESAHSWERGGSRSGSPPLLP